jgi:hypothetical protein
MNIAFIKKKDLRALSCRRSRALCKADSSKILPARPIRLGRTRG